MKLLAKNKKAYFDYQVLDTIEVGIVLRGDEVKSLRAGNVHMTGAFATIHEGELFMINCKIAHYEKAYSKSSQDEDVTVRSRKLLVHRRELTRLVGDISQKGITLVPLSIYLNNKNKIKIELGLCKHKKSTDKKQLIKERDIKRETQRELKNYKSN